MNLRKRNFTQRNILTDMKLNQLYENLIYMDCLYKYIDAMYETISKFTFATPQRMHTSYVNDNEAQFLCTHGSSSTIHMKSI